MMKGLTEHQPYYIINLLNERKVNKMKRRWYEIQLKYYTFPFFALPLYPIALIGEIIIRKREKKFKR